MKDKKTHWREIHNTDYLGAHDLVSEGIDDIVLTIKSAKKKSVKDQNGKDEICLVCEFEGSKPMIINATNSKAIEKVSGTPFIEDWNGTRVTVYIQKGIIAFGKKVDGLRIKEFAPKAAVSESDVKKDLALLGSSKSVKDLKANYEKCKFPRNSRVIAEKDRLKKELPNDNS
jgi:hypothetical protein